MSVSNLLYHSVHLLTLIGILSLGIGKFINEYLLVFSLFTLLFSYIGFLKGSKWFIPQRHASFLGIFVIIYILYEIVILNVELFIALLNFILLIQILKLVSCKEKRDLLQIFLLSFFQLVAAAISNFSYLFGLVLVFYVLIAICSLILLNLSSERTDEPDIKIEKSVSYSLFISSVLIWVLIFVLSVLAFVSLPRIRGGVISLGILKTNNLLVAKKSGFTWWVR